MITAIALLASNLCPLVQQAFDDAEAAPPPREVDGIMGVPIDIQSLSGSLTFNLKERSKKATADMVFRTTGAGGFPIFDLRQEIKSAMLDMKPIDPASMAAHDFGPRSGSMRILQHEVRPNTNCILHLEYELNRPDAPSARGALKRENGLFFSTNFTDLTPGRYLEQWFPSNLIYDRFSFELELKLEEARHKHLLITNAEVEKLGRHHWRLRWPQHTTAFSPMIVIAPESDLDHSTKTIKLAGGHKVKVEIARDKKSSGSLQEAHRQVAAALKDFSKTVGPWPHGNRCTVYLRDSSGSMEYDGATTTSMGAIRHEIFHSWFGRGVKPRSQNDGWWDEAWDVWFADGGRYQSMSFEQEGNPVELASADPWNRVTAGSSYGKGAQFFARVAALIGEDKLREQMAAFFNSYSLQTASTNDLENFLVAGSGVDGIRQLFSRYVYGRKPSADEEQK